MEERIAKVVAIFQQAQIRWALVGAHAIGTLTEPRATVGFDFVVEGSKLRAVTQALEQEFGDLDPVELGPGVRLRTLDVDLIRSTTHSLFQEALRHVRSVGDWKIPVPEVLIVLKFLAATSPWRDPSKRLVDVADLRTLYLDRKDELDGALVHRLATQVYPGAENELEALLQRIVRGEPLTI